MPAAAKQKVILTLEELLERLAYWQTHLGLTEWEFVLKVGRFSGLRDCQADVNWNLSKRQALIKILDAADYDANGFDWPQDMEESLLHELLHCHLAVLHREDETDLAEIGHEWAVNSLARALVTLARQARGWIVRPGEDQT
jgi:hypothetical protein